jgi:hypothetical protein
LQIMPIEPGLHRATSLPIKSRLVVERPGLQNASRL